MIPGEAACPIAYDHTDDLDECMICGWGAASPKPPVSAPRDISGMTGPERIQEAIKRLNGGYAPTRRIIFNRGGDEQ